MWQNGKLENSCIGFFQTRKLLQRNDISQKNLYFGICQEIETYYLLKNLEIYLLLTKNLKESYYRIADSFIKNNIAYGLLIRVEISFMFTWKIFLFQKKLHSDIMGFQLQHMHSLRFLGNGVWIIRKD